MTVQILKGDCREVLGTLPAESVHCVVTSPPYFGLRDYGMAGQIGMEATADDFVTELVAVFSAIRRVLRLDGTCWLNLGDSYNNRTKVRTTSHQPALNGFTDDNWAERAARGGVRMSRSDGDLKEKDLLGVPWMVAFALRAEGWYLRQDIIWSKPNPMPESVRDRCTKAHEYLFLLSKSERYYFDQEPIREDIKPSSGINMRASKHDGGRGDKIKDPNKDVTSKTYDEIKGANRRSVWEVTTQPFPDAHFATFPPALIEPCILAGCPKGGTVLDPFGGAGTTGLVADRNGRDAILIELNPAYAEMAERRIRGDAGMFAEVTS